MAPPRIRYNLGLGGVSKYETVRAKRLGRLFEWPMVLLAIWIPFQWYLERKGLLSIALSRTSYWLVWMIFTAELVLISCAVADKKRYLSQNWVNLVIVVLGFPPLWQVAPLTISLRGLRLVILLGVLMRLMRLMKQILRRNTLVTTLLVSFVVMLLAGVLMSFLDPAIKTPFDGIWWALVTVTTVGYGDLVPTTTAGRLFGALLIVLGVGLFALLTANFSAALIGQEVSELEQEESEIIQKLEAIERRLEAIETRLSNDQN